MNKSYIPTAGDRVRRENWSTDRWIDVLLVDGTDMFGRHEDGEPAIWGVTNWIKVEQKVPLPERWVNVYVPPGLCAETRAHADQVAYANRIAVIHIYTDAEGEDRADVERCEP